MSRDILDRIEELKKHKKDRDFYYFKNMFKEISQNYPNKKNNKDPNDVIYDITTQCNNIISEYNIKNMDDILTVQLESFTYFFFVKVDNSILIFKFFKDSLLQSNFILNPTMFEFKKITEDTIICFNKNQNLSFREKFIHLSQKTQLVNFLNKAILRINKNNKSNITF